MAYSTECLSIGGVRVRLRVLTLAGLIIIAIVIVIPKAVANVPFLLNQQLDNSLTFRVDSNIVTACVQLDGRCAFEITAKRADLPKRLQTVQQKFTQISRDYFQSPASSLDVQIRRASDSQPVIFVNNQELLTVTNQDASLRQTDSLTLAERIAGNLQQNLKRSKRERQPQFLVRSAKVAGGTGLFMVAASWSLVKWRWGKNDNLSQPKRSNLTTMQALAKKLTQQQQQNLKEVKRRLFQLAQVAIWGGD